MEGANAASSQVAAGGTGAGRPGARLLVALAVAAIVAFAAAFGIGAALKKGNTASGTPQLQSATGVQGAQRVQITAVGASAAIPGLKPKPAPPKPKSQPASTSAGTGTSAPVTSTPQSTTPPPTSSPPPSSTTPTSTGPVLGSSGSSPSSSNSAPVLGSSGG